MQRVASWDDMRMFGIAVTHGGSNAQAVARFNLTRSGRTVVMRCLDVHGLDLAEPVRNDRVIGDFIGSILLSREMLIPLAIVAFQLAGYDHIFQDDRGVIGIRAEDSQNDLEWAHSHLGPTKVFTRTD
jgi:hypothetical protein